MAEAFCQIRKYLQGFCQNCTLYRQVVGYIVSCSGDESLFQRKLVEADDIQGFPDIVSRAVVRAHLTGSGDSKQVKCFVYHSPPSDNMRRVSGGDWTKREREPGQYLQTEFLISLP